MADPNLPDKTKFNDYGKGLANPCDNQQGDGPSQLQNPKDDELEELFARMNLNLNPNPNPMRSPRNIWSDFRAPTMGSLYDGFKGGYYLNSTRSPPSQNMVPRASFSDTFARNRFLDSSIQRGTLSPLSPWLYNQQNYYYPTRPRSDHSSWLLRELRGRVCEFAKDQNGCRLLQTKLDDKILSGEEIEMLFIEVKDHLHELVVHRFANYLVQKLFRACNQELRTHLLLLLVCIPHRFLEICTDVHGSRTVQKFIDRITTREQRCIIFSALRPIAVILAKNSNGHHIIQECLLKFSNRELRLVMESFVDHCIYIATNQSGCFVVQQCLRHADPEMRGLLLGQIIANAILLSEDEYGNYVVQFVLEMKDDYLTARIIAELEGSFVTLSFSKYGSNVVEKCLKVSGEQLSAMIIREIMNDPDFVKVIGHDYGNYVAQSALSVSKGDLRNAFLALIRYHYSFLQSNPFGRRVLSRTKSCKNDR